MNTTTLEPRTSADAEQIFVCDWVLPPEPLAVPPSAEVIGPMC